MDWHGALFDASKLLLAALLGGAIGFERETHGQAAGLRTYTLVCVGSCLIMLLSLNMEAMYRALDVSQSVVRLDPGRIASYAIAGIGFLGAGAIIKGRGTIRGLTTAAGLWLVTGVGLSVGANYIIPAVCTTLISILLLFRFRRLKTIFPRDEYTILTVRSRESASTIRRIRQILSEYPGFSIQFVNFSKDFTAGTTTYRLRINSKDNMPWPKVVRRIGEIEGIEEIRWEEGEVP